MKVFLSWSGSESKQLATIFKEWLPNVLQYVDPYMSAQDINMGERWGNSIADNLEESVFGLIFVTPSNIKAPWLNFEAGALSKKFESRVIPILYKAEVTILDQGPLKQFQSTKNLEKDSILSLLQSINISNQDGRLDESRLEKAFEMWWQPLEEAINAIVNGDRNESNEGEDGPTDRDLLNVIYSKLVEQEKTINQQKMLHERRIPRIPTGLIKEVKTTSTMMYNCIDELVSIEGSVEIMKDLEAGAHNLEQVARYLEAKNR
ncbi:toll/interleukin-1 receptor domain-containing protein [Bacillus sp. Brlt_9]|uniref:toll/interleukin-1 receptor domain-containing protein n=1 Tax=Bacillus sp. Brlt_9 TaxID=3110916 RepID=UPI003F7BC504